MQAAHRRRTWSRQPSAVAVHACRHLALLATIDHEVTLTSSALPGLWEPITKLTPGTAGSLQPVPLA